MHAASAARPGRDEQQALYTPAASDFSGLRPNTLYKYRRQTELTGVQHGPLFQHDAAGRPFYTRGDLLDWRRAQAIAKARRAKATRRTAKRKKAAP
jgi:hypothetical protein